MNNLKHSSNENKKKYKKRLYASRCCNTQGRQEKKYAISKITKTFTLL